MIEVFYQWYIRLEELNIKGRRWLYKILKLIVNIFYPITIPFHNNYGLDETSNFIISFTSFPQRIKTVYITADTLLRQTKRPYKVLLYLAKAQFPNGEADLPKSLLALKKRGLEIVFCEDLKSHKKYYYAMKDHADKILITADDDMFYSVRLAEQLMNKHEEYPNAVVCNWGHIITFDKLGNINRYLKWKGGVSGFTKPSILLSPVGAEGVLYPPRSADEILFNQELFERIAPFADDLWLKMMCVKNNVKAVRAINTAIPYFNIVMAQKFTLQKTNIHENRNDVQMSLILREFPEVMRILQKSENENE